MSESKILLPGQSAPQFGRVAIIGAATAGKALLLPDHIVQERKQSREQRQRMAKLRKLRVDAVNKAQDQLAQVSSRARSGHKLTEDERREVNFLAGVATNGASRRERRDALRKMKLLSSQQRCIVPKGKTTEDEATGSESA